MVFESQSQQPSINLYPGGNGGNGGNGGMFGSLFGGDGSMLSIIILFFFFMMIIGGWGNNGNNNGGGNGGGGYMPYPYMYPPMMLGAGVGGGNNCNCGNSIQQGFDQAAVISGINGINAGMQTGFANAEVSRCNSQANLLATMNNNQNATTAALQSQAMALQNCCCENRANIADVKYALATEACADRAAVTNALSELTAQNNANMNAMMNMFNAGIQSLKDDNCQWRLDQKDAQIADLQRQLTFAQTADLVNNSRNAILSNNDLQTAALEQYLAPVPKPAYVVQNPSCCNQSGYYNPCQCNRFAS